MNVTEMNALLGLLVLCYIFKSSRESLNSLFSTGITGRPILRCIMLEKKCHILLRAMRLYDKSTHLVREENDPAAPISDIYKAIVKNFMSNYSIGAFACVAETLVPFRGRCHFQMYMPKKAARHGLKLVCITDSNSSMYDSYIYTGKGPYSSHPKSEGHSQKHNICGVTVENGLTVTGTLRGNKPQIPAEFLPQKDRPVNSSLYGFTKELTLVSFVPKKKKS
ncbi:hypothetical protein PR048_021556 [Dryococelus australis]|uniref:PiggyBac transposable element-derived protein domain-containing protein n=1 Tax=Dryococelus australis TaxID=614101 RepID=A0ABQ9GYI5_9NEOP|nr:hypothetical protein PR048_021556 [Dryococelus australis]